MTIKIEKNINIPISSGKYPFKSMSVGDSFLAPVGTVRGPLGTAAGRAAAEMNGKFTIRQTPDGLRCWRIA